MLVLGAAKTCFGDLIATVILCRWMSATALGSPFFGLVAEHADVFAALPPNLHEALLREYISGASGPGLRPEVLDLDRSAR